MGIQGPAGSRLRGLLAVGLLAAVAAGFLAIIVVPAFMVVHGRRDMLVYEQAVVFVLIAWQSCSVARREHRAVDRNSLLLLGGLAASGVGQLLMDSYLTRVVDLALGYAGLAIICLGFGLVVASYVGKRQAAKRRERRALMARLTHVLRSRSPC